MVIQIENQKNSRQLRRAVIVDNDHAVSRRLQPLSINDVQLNDDFWEPRRQTNRIKTLRDQYEQCKATGRLDNFRRVAGTYTGPYQGIYFNDSDVYKWVEAASWTLATDSDPELEQLLDGVIALIAAAQDDNGYINTYFSVERVAERWTNLKDMHELYCAGHLIQAAIAHHRSTGKETLLQVVVRLADHIISVFGPTGRAGACGHPEIEMALVELARETGDQRYVQGAQFFVDQHGHHPPTISGDAYHLDHAPLREQSSVTGHAVRALYLYAGATDVQAETGEESLGQAIETLWHDLNEHQIYVTGGVGSRYEGEAFGEDYELPNRRAYTETCAAIANVMWNWRLLLQKGEARFSDALETSLYNGVISGSSLDGQLYFYQNPLADRGNHRRQPWFHCACCPPNLARLLASLPGYLYSTSAEGVWCHLYATNTATIVLSDGRTVAIQQETNYPWSGDITFTLIPDEPADFSVFLRIPAWSCGATIKINGAALAISCDPGSYVDVNRHWQAGDVISLALTMSVFLLESHPFVLNNLGRVAIKRGPFVYCVEQVDNPECDIWNLSIPGNADWTIIPRSDLLNGIVTLQTQAQASTTEAWSQQLYRTYTEPVTETKTVMLTAIPYYAWANREAGPMQVWLPRQKN